MDRTAANSDDDSFSFGLAELRRAAAARARPAEAAAPARNAVRDARARPMTNSLDLMKTPPGGFDPYNSTGGFDRNNAWNRIRKR